MLLGNAISCVAWGLLYTSIQPSTAALVPRDSNIATPASAPTAVSTAPSSSSIPDDINTMELGNPSDPTWIAKLTNVTNGLPTSFGGDETLPIDDVTITSDRFQRLARLNLLFPGVFWDKAYPDQDSQSCTPAQFNILEMATRASVRLTHYSPTNTEDEAFMSYFVTDGRVSGRWSNGPNRGRYLQLINNLKQVAGFPSQGDSKGRMLQNWRIGYLCGKIPEEVDKCAINPDTLLAYTVRRYPDGKSEFGTVVIFCAKFFTLHFADMITAGPKKDSTVLDDPDLDTFERTIMHEWMHSSPPIGFAERIIDIDKGNKDKVVYGSQRCHDRAWLNMPGDPNPEIVLNADNYAWTWIFREFARVWGWSDSLTSSVDNTYTTTDIWTNLTAPVDPPLNCVQNSTGIDCSYIGMSYDDYLLDQGVACNCTGTICSNNSPACCATIACSNCDDIKANATEPSDVPSCCASNTCLWDLGSNINGAIS